MPIDPEALWKQRFKGLQTDGSGASWADKMADAVDQGVTGKLQVSGLTGSVTFTFKKDIFANMLKLAVPSPSPFSGAQAIATAFQVACLSSTIVVAPGAFVGAPTPPTTFSVVISSLLDPPGIAAGYSIVFGTLTTMSAVPDAAEGIVGPAIRKGFTMLTVTVTGLNSVPPPVGPQPLVAPLLPVM